MTCPKYDANGDLPAPVKAALPTPHAQTAFREAHTSAMANGATPKQAHAHGMMSAKTLMKSGGLPPTPNYKARAMRPGGQP